MLASRLEDDSMSYDVFSPILYYANLAPASGEVHAGDPFRHGASQQSAPELSSDN